MTGADPIVIQPLLGLGGPTVIYSLLRLTGAGRSYCYLAIVIPLFFPIVFDCSFSVVLRTAIYILLM